MLYDSCKILLFFGKYKAFTPYAFSNATGSLKAENGRGILSVARSPIQLSSGNRQADKGNDMNTYSHDPAALAVALDLKNAVHVGYYTEDGKVTRYKEVIMNQASFSWKARINTF